MGRLSPRRVGIGLLPLVVLSAMAFAACTETATPTPASTPTPIPTIQVNLAFQVSDEDVRWFRNVEVPKGTNAYELTELVTNGELQATFYPLFRSHFVEGLLGIENKDPNYWLMFVWDESQTAWAPLPVGADLYSLKDGHVLAWAFTDTSKGQDQVPSLTP